MLSFTQWLNEANFTFQNAKDQDYTVDPSKVLVISMDEPQKYRVEGRTHGSASHAIKHLSEYDPSLVKQYVNSVRTVIDKALKRHSNMFCAIWNNKSGNFSQQRGIDALNTASDDVILNFLDIVNDKMKTNTTLLKVESQIRSIIEKMEKDYLSIIENKIDKSVNLEKFNSEEAIERAIQRASSISFLKDSQHMLQRVLIDLSDGTVIIGSKDLSRVNTMFRLDGAIGGKKDILRVAYHRRHIPLNPMIDTVIRKLIS